MSATINLIFVGRLGNDPQLKQLPSGATVCTFSVAVDNDYKNAEGEKVERTIWLRCEAWNRLGEVAHQYLSKGSLVWVEGVPSAHAYINREGVPSASLDVRINSLRFLSTRGQNTYVESPAEEEVEEDLPNSSEIPF